MPVDTPHPQYALYAPIWTKIRDCLDGEDAIKAKGQLYLPPLNGQRAAEYAAYLQRATFHNATGATLLEAVGVIFRKPPVLAPPLPEALQEWPQDVTLSGVPLTTFLRQCVTSQIAFARYGVLLDMPPPGAGVALPKLAGYPPEAITLWREEIRRGVKTLTLVVLKEVEEQIDPDGFGSTLTTVYRVLDFDAEGWYRQRLFRRQGDAWIETEVTPPPNRRQERLSFLPFVFFGASDLTPDCEKPMLLDLVNTNLAHYRQSADYRNLLHWGAVVQPYVATNDDISEIYFGASSALILRQGDSAGFLEAGGASISAQKEALMDDEARMASYGAKIFQEKAGVEAAETVFLRQAARTATLSTVADTASRGFTQLLRWAVWWAGAAETPTASPVSLTVNSEFIESTMAPADLLSYLTVVQGGLLSKQTALWNIKRGGLLPDSRSVEDELALIAAQTETPAAAPDVLDDNQ